MCDGKVNAWLNFSISIIFFIKNKNNTILTQTDNPLLTQIDNQPNYLITTLCYIN